MGEVVGGIAPENKDQAWKKKSKQHKQRRSSLRRKLPKKSRNRSRSRSLSRGCKVSSASAKIAVPNRAASGAETDEASAAEMIGVRKEIGARAVGAEDVRLKVRPILSSKN